MSKQPLAAPPRSHCEHVSRISAELTPQDVERQRRPGRCHWCQRRDPDLWLCLHADCALLGCGEPADHSGRHFAAQPHHCLALNTTTMRVWCYVCTEEVFLDNNEPPVAGGGVAVAAQDVVMAGVGGSSSSESEEEGDGDDSDAEERPPRGLTGLRNIGNTCYMNAALQALSNLPPLTRYFLDCEQLVPVDRKPGLARSFCRLLHQMWDRRRASFLAPTAVQQAMRAAHPQFRGFQQHDSQEFLRCFMDAMHEELRRPRGQRPPPPAAAAAPCDHSAGGDHDDQSATESDVDNDDDDEDYETADSGVSEHSAEPPRRRRRRRQPTPDDEPAGGGGGGGGSSVEFADAEAETEPLQRPAEPHLGRTPPSDAGDDASGGRTQYCSIVSDVFDGRILSSVQCLTCNCVSATRETFQDLSLPIPSREQLSVLHAQPRAPAPPGCGQLGSAGERGWAGWLWDWLSDWLTGPSVSLHDCLASFFSSDELKGDNMYSCGRCKMLRNGVKFCRVLELPEVLTIHLKRFRHELVYPAKLSTHVQFPLTGLDMAGYLHNHSTSQVTRYNLAAVVCHHGTAGAGHYTALAQNPDNGRWYEYDDQYVTQVSTDAVAGCQAYVLFYRKACEQATQRRQRAAELVRRSRADPSLLPYYVSRQWIAKFNTFAEPGPIDNWDFLCRHGGVRPALAAPLPAVCAQFPQAGWEYLHGALGGAPVANALYQCAVCAAEWEALLARRRREQADFRRLQTAEAPAAAAAAAWFRRWEAFVRGREPQPPGPIDNSGIVVTRGGQPQLRAGSDHVQLSQQLWNYLSAIYGGGPEVALVPAAAAGGAAAQTSPARQRAQPHLTGSPLLVREDATSPIARVHRRCRTGSDQATRRARPLADEAERNTRPRTDDTELDARPLADAERNPRPCTDDLTECAARAAAADETEGDTVDPAAEAAAEADAGGWAEETEADGWHAGAPVPKSPERGGRAGGDQPGAAAANL